MLYKIKVLSDELLSHFAYHPSFQKPDTSKTMSLGHLVVEQDPQEEIMHLLSPCHQEENVYQYREEHSLYLSVGVSFLKKGEKLPEITTN